MKKMEQDCL